jgi:hypothetical protein
MTYDHWKTTNPADQWLGPEPEEDDGMTDEPLIDDPGAATSRDLAKSQWQAAQRGQFTIWTIYDRPIDHPDGFIARRFEVGGGQTVATPEILTGDIKDIRQAFWKAGLMQRSRQEGDEPQIVESWV